MSVVVVAISHMLRNEQGERSKTNNKHNNTVTTRFYICTQGGEWHVECQWDDEG